MSLATFKRKSVVRYGTTHTGTSVASQGWLGQNPSTLTWGHTGFSLEGNSGTNRTGTGFVGRSYAMSKSGTPYRGVHAVGWGGTGGRYPRTAETMNVTDTSAELMGTQYKYVRPSVLSAKGMLQNRFKWIRRPYPFAWVQPVYTGNLTDTSSQGTYIHTLAAQHTCSLKVNDTELYAGDKPMCACGAAYTKTLHQPVPTYDSYLSHLTRKCEHPIGKQKPFPYAVTTGKSMSAAGTSITSFANACNTSQRVELTPPAWYYEPQSQVP